MNNNTYPTEHGDIYLLNDRKEIGYNLNGIQYSLHPSQLHTAGEPIVKGLAVSIANADWATEEIGSALDAGKIFVSEESNTDKACGISLNGGVYGESVEVLDHGLYSWQAPSLLILTITNSSAGTIIINGNSLTLSGATENDLAASIISQWNSLPSSKKVNWTVTNPSGAIVEIQSTIPQEIIPSAVQGTGPTFTYFYANRITAVVLTSRAEGANRSVIINGNSYSGITGANSSAVAASIRALSIPDYTLSGTGDTVVITTTSSSLGIIPTISNSTLQYTTIDVTNTSYTIFQPGDIGQTVFIRSYNDPTSIIFKVVSTDSESGATFGFNGSSYGSISGADSDAIASAISNIEISGFVSSKPTSDSVKISSTNGTTITSLTLGTLQNTQFIPLAMDLIPTQQFTTDRSKALESGAVLIELGVVKDLNTIFIDFEGDARGSVNLSQISVVSGEEITSDGTPFVVSIGTDGTAYLADKRKSNNGGSANRNNATGFAIGSTIGWGSTIPLGTPLIIQKAGVIPGFTSLTPGYPIYADITGSYTQNLNSLNFYTDIATPLGFALSATSVYVEVGFNTQATDAPQIGSIVKMNEDPADYGYMPCTSGLTITGNTGAIAGYLNGVGTTVITAGSGISSGTYDFTSLYEKIGTSYGGVVAWYVSGSGTCSGTVTLNGINYSPTGANASAVAASIATLIASNQSGYVCSNPSGAVVTISNTNAVLPPIFVSNLTNYTIALSTDNGGTTGITFALPDLNGGTPKFQIAYLNLDIVNPPEAPIFRWDSGWTQWGVLPQGTTGVANQYFEIPVTEFGADFPITSVFTELYVQKGSVTRLIDSQPIWDGTHRYGYQVAKDQANNIRIEFADNGLAYNVRLTGFTAIDSTWTYRLFIYKTERYNKYYDHTADTKLAQLWSLGFADLIQSTSIQGSGYFDRSSTQPIHTTRLNYDGTLYATTVRVSTSLYVDNTNGTCQIDAGTIDLRGMTYLKNSNGTVTYWTISNSSGNMVSSTGAAIQTSGNISTTGSGTLDIAGTSALRSTVSILGATTINVSGTPLTIQNGSTVTKATISSGGNIDTYGNISTHSGSTGTLSIDGVSTFTGAITANAATFKGNVLIKSSDGNTIYWTLSNTGSISSATAGSITTTGNISTTGSGTLSIGGTSVFTGIVTCNSTVNTNGSSIDSTTATFNVYATPTTINFAAACSALNIGTTTGTCTIKNASLILSGASGLTVQSGIGIFGNATHAGNIQLFDGATNTASIVNASALLTLSQTASNAAIVLSTTGVERFRAIYSGAVISNIAGVGHGSDSTATLKLVSPSTSTLNEVGILFTAVSASNSARSSKLIYSTIDNSFHFGGANDTTDGASIKCGSITGALWNDYADCIETDVIEFGKVYVRKNGKNIISTKYCEEGLLGVASDTYAMVVGKKDLNQVPIAVSGFVLAYVDKEYSSGTPLTSGKNGYLTEISMIDKILYPERIIGIFYKNENSITINLNERTIVVNERKWVKVK